MESADASAVDALEEGRNWPSCTRLPASGTECEPARGRVALPCLLQGGAVPAVRLSRRAAIADTVASTTTPTALALARTLALPPE